MVGKNILLEGLNRVKDAPTSPLVQMWIKKHRCLVSTILHMWNKIKAWPFKWCIPSYFNVPTYLVADFLKTHTHDTL